MKTCGISPKVWAPTAALLTAFVVNWIASGEFDRTELSLIVSTGLTAFFGYWAGPGDVVADAVTGGDGGQAGQVSEGLVAALALVAIAVILAIALL